MENLKYSLIKSSTDTSKAFDVRFSSVSKELIIDCSISPAKDPGTVCRKMTVPVRALWDTGCSISGVTKSVVKQLGLNPVRTAEVFDGGGFRKTNIYFVHIHLPNDVIIPLFVMGSENYPSFEILVGMDVICRGYFMVRNSDNRTALHFELPIIEESLNVLSSKGVKENYTLKLFKEGGLNTAVLKYNKPVNKIIFDSFVCSLDERNTKKLPVRAFLDTGAEMTIIARSVIHQLGIKQLLTLDSFHAGGKCKTKIYKLGILLPNQEVVFIPVCDGPDNSEFQLLIGMDILSIANFSISHTKEGSIFIFSTPQAV